MATANQSETCGIRNGGDINVGGNLVNVVNSSTPLTPASSGGRKSPFRFNIPVQTPHYKGRQDILDKLGNHFGHSTSFRTKVQKVFKPVSNFFSRRPAQPSCCWDRMVAILGMGGIGKTELACQFADKFRRIYPNAAWIDAETEESALNSFLGLAKSLEIVSEGRQKADLEFVKKIYGHIDANYPHKVLLIFDNAIMLQSDEKDFGIVDYLPTEDLPNQRFPFVVITSQTPDWQKGIMAIQLEELSEEESLSFFRSSFKISSSKCDQAFKMLHSRLQGYPLAMNMAASNIDFEPDKHSLNWLQEQIELYVEKFEKEDSSILTQKINQNWTNKYSKTLSTVWQLCFQRLKNDPNGANALMLLQAVSFFHVPVNTPDLRGVFIECHFCLLTPDWMKYSSLKESIRLLQRYQIVDCVFKELDYSERLKAFQSNAEKHSEDLSSKFQEQVKSAKSFVCELRVHRLVQLVVRLDMDCSVVLEDILRFLAFWAKSSYIRLLNMSAVEEAFGRTALSTRALAFAGLLALQGNSAARRIIQSSTAPMNDPAATIWRVLQLDKNIKTLNEEAIQMLRAFVVLSTSEKSLIDKRCFAEMALEMFYDRRIFPCVRDDGTSAPGICLQSLKEMNDIACELISTSCSLTDVCSLPLLCRNVHRINTATLTVLVGNQIIEDLTQEKKPESQIAQLKEELSAYREFVDRGKSKWHEFQEEFREIINSDDSWEKFESEVETCGLDQLKLKQVFFSIFHKIWTATNNKNFIDKHRSGYAFRELDYVIHTFLLTRRSREILIPLLESFVEILVKTEKEQLSVLQNPGGDNNNAAIWICTSLISFCTQWDGFGSHDLFNCLSRVRILTAIKKVSINRIRDALQVFGRWDFLKEQHETTYVEFMKIYSESPVEEIRTLVNFCKEIQREMPVARKQYGLHR